MQIGDLETQSTNHAVTPAVEHATATVNGSMQVQTLQEPVVPLRADVGAESVSWGSGESRLSAKIGSLLHWLRDQRREAAAIVVLLIMGITWFDSGRSRTDSASAPLSPLDGYEAVMSDFQPVGDGRPLRESADPIEAPFQNSYGSSIFIPEADESMSASTVKTQPATADYGDSTAASAQNQGEASAFDASSAHHSAGYGSDPQPRRKVKFASVVLA